MSNAAAEQQIDQWRAYLRRRQAVHDVDVAELEDHLREHIATLTEQGLASDEAFLIAVKRMGALDALSREFAREHSERLWKQLVVAPEGTESGGARRNAIVAFGLAVAAAAAIKAPALFGLRVEADFNFYARNIALFVLPFLTGYFIWKRRLDGRAAMLLAAAFVAAACFANLYPFVPRISNTEALAALHAPIALWLVVGIAYAGGRWGRVDGRMDFVRFSGELFIYYVLIAMGGVVLCAFLMMIFQSLGVDISPVIANWLLPCGAAGAVLIASWLVEAKQSVIENMAPVLAGVFTPLFAVALIAFLGVAVVTGRAVDIQRDVLIVFDLLLVLVVGLLLYAISARDPRKRPGLYDYAQVALVIAALLADAVALWAITARIGEFGATPNRIAALGENIILLVNLAWSAALYVRFLSGRGPFAALERWQTDYLPVFAAWAAIVVIVFPPLFFFM